LFIMKKTRDLVKPVTADKPLK